MDHVGAYDTFNEKRRGHKAYPVDLMASISLSALVYSRGEGPRQTVSSASCTWELRASGSVNTATASRPRLCALRITLLAISPLLAIRMRALFFEWPVGRGFSVGGRNAGQAMLFRPEGTLTCNRATKPHMLACRLTVHGLTSFESSRRTPGSQIRSGLSIVRTAVQECKPA